MFGTLLKVAATALVVAGSVGAQPQVAKGTPAVGVAVLATQQSTSQLPSLQLQVVPRQIPVLIRNTFAPTMALMNPEDAAVGQLVTLSFKISGLKGARAVHLYRFTPGCLAERQLAIQGLPIRLDVPDVRYTTDALETPTQRTNFRAPASPGLVVDQNGEARLDFRGVIGVPGGGSARFQAALPDNASLQSREAMDEFARTILDDQRSCTPSAAFVFMAADGKWYTLDRDNNLLDVTDPALTALVTRPGSTWLPRPRRLKSVINTRHLRDLLSPFMSSFEGGSTCRGISVAFGQPNFLVGVREKDGDLTFAIRSGPAGTKCAVVFNRADLPPGVTVVSARFSVEKDGSKCRLGNTRLPQDSFVLLAPAFLSPHSLDRVSAVVRQPELITAGVVSPGANGWLNPFKFPQIEVDGIRWQAHFAPMGVTLSCDVTAVNDHGITLRFDSADFLVPDGVNLALPVD